DVNAYSKRQRPRHHKERAVERGINRVARHERARAPDWRPDQDHRRPWARYNSLSERPGDGTEVKMTRILLVDDHPIVRQGIKQVLAGAFDPAVVGEAATAAEGMSELRSTDWDVMVLDIT